MAEQPASGYLQTVAHDIAIDKHDITNKDNDLNPANYNLDHESSETADILFKYQQHYNQRKQTHKDGVLSPTRNKYAGTFPSGINHPSCLKESLPLLFAWFGYFVHMTVAILPETVFFGVMDTEHFYAKYSLDISPASWVVIQFGIEILWQGILLTYLSLLIAEHTLKIFPNGFYYGLALANISLASWDICTEHKSFVGRLISWLCVALCLIWSNYVLLRHIYATHDVTKFMTHIWDDSDYLPPSCVNNIEKTTTSRNINAILRMKGGVSLNSSPTSMSMAPSAAQKLVYDAALAAAEPADDDWLYTKVDDITRVKYSGLVGIVFNGTSFFLSLVVINLWVQFGLLLKYKCGTTDNVASVIALTMIFTSMFIYYCCDFYYLEKYFVDNFATHIVFCLSFAAMTSKHFFGKRKDESRSLCEDLQMIGFCIVSVVSILKIIKSIRVHKKYRKQLRNVSRDEYKRVI